MYSHTYSQEPSVKGHQMGAEELTRNFPRSVALPSTVLDRESSQVPRADWGGDVGEGTVEVNLKLPTHSLSRKPGGTVADTRGKWRHLEPSGSFHQEATYIVEVR